MSDDLWQLIGWLTAGGIGFFLGQLHEIDKRARIRRAVRKVAGNPTGMWTDGTALMERLRKQNAEREAVDAEVLRLVKAGRTIDAITFVRRDESISLLDAKRYVEHVMDKVASQ